MKIAILVPMFPPKWLAGTEIATWNIAKHLATRGHEVHVITSLDKGLAKETIENGFYISRIGFPRVRFIGIILFWLQALLALRKISPDIVHAQSIPMGLCALLVKKILKKPYIVYSRGELYLSWTFKTLVSKLVLRSADVVIALTNDMRRKISKIYGGDVYIIPNGIELERFANLSKQNSRDKLNIAEDDKVVIFVGRFRPEKDVTCLIKAMEIMVERNPKMKLFVIGEGEEEEQLKELTKKLNLDWHVNFVGQVAYRKVPEYMAAADVFVLPSLSEGFPLVMPEAMACGLPIVATKVGGVPEIITDGENGLLVEPKNPQQIAEKVLLLLGDDELRQKISKSNKDKVKNYSWENVIQRLEELYQSLL